MSKLGLTLFSLVAFVWCAQSQTTLDLKEKYKKNQQKIDENHAGVGPTVFKPGLGKGVVVPGYWSGINIVSDIFEFRFGLGRTNKIQRNGLDFNDQPYPIGKFGTDMGYLFSGGVNYPLKFATFGAYQNSVRQFRGHPTIGVHMGNFHFRDSSTYSRKTNASFISVAPGYRLRFPLVTLEFNLDMRLGMSWGDESDYYRGSGIFPFLTLRFDALKGLLNPSMVSVPASLSTVTNVQSTTTTSTSYTSTHKITTYTTRTTYDVNVSNFNAGIQDIGPHFGIGPKFSFMSARRGNHIELGRLYGIVAEGRASAIDFGLTLEGGKVGHGTVLEFKDENVARKKLRKSQSVPAGTMNTVNAFANIGIDVSPLLLAPFGLMVDKGEATSFMSASAGVILGGHYSFNQQYNVGFDTNDIKVPNLDPNDGEIKEKHIDPTQIGPGFLGGFYFGVHVGALSFKATNYRYFGAPFASTTMYSLAWKIPIVYDR